MPNLSMEGESELLAASISMFVVKKVANGVEHLNLSSFDWPRLRDITDEAMSCSHNAIGEMGNLGKLFCSTLHHPLSLRSI